MYLVLYKDFHIGLLCYNGGYFNVLCNVKSLINRDRFLSCHILIYISDLSILKYFTTKNYVEY